MNSEYVEAIRDIITELREAKFECEAGSLENFLPFNKLEWMVDFPVDAIALQSLKNIASGESK